MKTDNVIIDKSLAFSVRIIRMSEFLQQKRAYQLADQVMRSGTSIGANIREARRAQSTKDFIAKSTYH